MSGSTKKPKLSTEEIAAEIRAEILSGQLGSGKPLRQDDIAARFGVSKIPVREALFQLKAEGLVTFVPNKGAAVSVLSPKEADEIYAMRIALETAALERAIPNLTIRNLTEAEELLTAIDQEEKIGRWGELNWQFHATLYAPADMPRMLDWIQALHVNIARYLILYLEGMNYQEASQRQHRELLDACRYGDIYRAKEILVQHLESASHQLVDFLEGAQ
ncbi:MAG: GntR family transcriptional regulator [Chloroflexota bacterium]